MFGRNERATARATARGRAGSGSKGRITARRPMRSFILLRTRTSTDLNHKLATDICSRCNGPDPCLVVTPSYCSCGVAGSAVVMRCVSCHVSLRTAMKIALLAVMCCISQQRCVAGYNFNFTRGAQLVASSNAASMDVHNRIHQAGQPSCMCIKALLSVVRFNPTFSVAQACSCDLEMQRSR